MMLQSFGTAHRAALSYPYPSGFPGSLFQFVYQYSGRVLLAESRMEFVLLSELINVETFASGKSIRNIKLLNKRYGFGKWRKRKGTALIRLKDGSECLAELHWYEASGFGRKEMKVKWLLN